MPIPPADFLVGTNLSLVVGDLSRPPELRELPSGDHLLALEVTVSPPAGARESVPVVWPAAPVAASVWQPGDRLLVVGRVRRRFFRAGGVTQSRTEVVATSVTPTRRAATVRRAVRAAIAEVERGL